MSIPFRAASPMKKDEIEKIAESIREIFQLGTVKPVQKMASLIEVVLPELLPGYIFLVLPDEEMPGMDGLSAIDEDTIYLSNSTYVALCNGEPEARLTASHEFGHLVLHAGQSLAFAKRTRNDDTVDPEWQADRFAEAFLMPWDGVARCRSAVHVAAKYSVPDNIAERRFAEVKAGREIQGELFA